MSANDVGNLITAVAALIAAVAGLLSWFNGHKNLGAILTTHGAVADVASQVVDVANKAETVKVNLEAKNGSDANTVHSLTQAVGVLATRMDALSQKSAVDLAAMIDAKLSAAPPLSGVINLTADVAKVQTPAATVQQVPSTEVKHD
jgi:hypothetical protein